MKDLVDLPHFHLISNLIIIKLEDLISSSQLIKIKSIIKPKINTLFTVEMALDQLLEVIQLKYKIISIKTQQAILT
jgi:hypothetical protein